MKHGNIRMRPAITRHAEMRGFTATGGITLGGIPVKAEFSVKSRISCLSDRKNSSPPYNRAQTYVTHQPEPTSIELRGNPP
jgi:hypothetical protein